MTNSQIFSFDSKADTISKCERAHLVKFSPLLPPAKELRQGNAGYTRPVIMFTVWADTPWVDTPYPVHAGYTPLPSACWDTVNKRAVHFLLEYILVPSVQFTPDKSHLWMDAKGPNANLCVSSHYETNINWCKFTLHFSFPRRFIFSLVFSIYYSNDLPLKVTLPWRPTRPHTVPQKGEPSPSTSAFILLFAQDDLEPKLREIAVLAPALWVSKDIPSSKDQFRLWQCGTGKQGNYTWLPNILKVLWTDQAAAAAAA